VEKKEHWIAFVAVRVAAREEDSVLGFSVRTGALKFGLAKPRIPCLDASGRYLCKQYAELREKRDDEHAPREAAQKTGTSGYVALHGGSGNLKELGIPLIYKALQCVEWCVK
jgi:hypothetical protein